jgi:hypothetical protein
LQNFSSRFFFLLVVGCIIWYFNENANIESKRNEGPHKEHAS